MMRRFIFLSLNILIAVSSVVNVQAVEPELYQGESSSGLLLSAASRSIEFTVLNENGTELARFRGTETSPSLIYTTKDFKFDDWESWGLSLEFSHSRFELDTQYDSLDNQLNLATSVEGSFTYGLAAFTLHSDDKRADRQDEQGFILGLCAGLAIMDASGTVVYTDTDNSRHAISVNSFGPILGLYGEYRISGFFARLQILATGGNEIKSSDSEAANNQYVVGDSSFNLGYSIYF